MSGLSGLKKTRPAANAPSGYDNAVGQVVGYEIKDPKGMKADPADTVVVRLMRDLPLLGISALDAEGQPSTEIKIRLREVENKSDSGYARPEIIDKKKGKGQAPAVKKGDLLQFEGLQKEKDGIYSARWVNTFVSGYDTEKHFPLIGRQMSIRRAFTREENGEQKEKQNRIALIDESAVVFKGEADFKTKAVEAFDAVADLGFDNLLVVRVVDLNDNAAYKIEIWRQWDREAGAMEAPEKAVSRFLADPDNKDWVENIRADDANALWEVVPAIRVVTGTLSLPSSRRGSAKVAVTEANAFKYDDSYLCRYAEDGQINYGWIAGDMKVERKVEKADDSDEIRASRWFSTGVFRAQTRDAILGEAEFLTPNLPDHVRKHFEKKVRSSFREAAPPKATEKAADQSFGQEDAPSHGM